jgi:hypothetical protein
MQETARSFMLPVVQALLDILDRIAKRPRRERRDTGIRL